MNCIFLSPRNKYSSTVAQEAKAIYKKQLSQAYKKTGRKPIISLDQGHRNGSVCHSVSLIK